MINVFAPILFFSAEAFAVASARDFTIPEVDRGYYCALCSVHEWSDGNTSHSAYYSRAREALMGTLGSKDVRVRHVQREIYRLIKPRMPEFYTERVDKELGQEGLF